MPVEVSTTRSGWLMRMPSTVASPLPFAAASRFAVSPAAAVLALVCAPRLGSSRPSCVCRSLSRATSAGRRAPARGRSRSRPCPRAGRGRPNGGCGRRASTRRTTPRRRASARPSGRARRAASRRTASSRLAIAASACFTGGERLLVEAAADAAGEAQVPGLVVDAEQERADAGARALRIGPAADDELLALRALELDPGGAAPRHVRAHRRACRSFPRGACGTRSGAAPSGSSRSPG